MSKPVKIVLIVLIVALLIFGVIFAVAVAGLTVTLIVKKRMK